MSFLDQTGIAGGIADLLGKVIDRAWPDESKKAEAQLALFKMQQEGEFNEIEQQIRLGLAQSDINKVEAASPDFFRSGWRPAIGWVCASGLAYQYLIRPLLIGLLGKPAPDLDLSTLMQLLFGMLGLGAMRTIEKIKGVS